MADVILRRSSLGDVVLLGSATAALPEPAIVVTDRRWLSLVARFRGVREVVPWPEREADLPPGRRVDLHLFNLEPLSLYLERKTRNVQRDS